MFSITSDFTCTTAGFLLNLLALPTIVKNFTTSRLLSEAIIGENY